MGSASEPMIFYVEQSPAGGWRVMLRGHVVPVSTHDTEEDALQRMKSYVAGAATEAKPPSTASVDA